MTGKGNKYYVVFRGRNPGIYYSWDECRAQVHGFKNNRHERYRTLEEAQQALQEYFANPDSMESPSSSHPWHHVDSEGISGGTPNLSQASTSPFSPVQQNSQTNNERKPDPVHGTSQGSKGDEVVLKFSMKDCLIEACKVLGIDCPEFFAYPAKIINGSPHHSYMCYLRSEKIHETPVEVGPYETSPEMAMEQVSLKWLRRLENWHNLSVEDYNHYTVQLKNDRIQCLEAENFDLVMENASLKQQNLDLKRMLNHL